MRVLRYGRSGLLLELDSTTAVSAAYRLLGTARADGRLPGVVELVPAARTVLVETATAAPPPTLLTELLAELQVSAETPADSDDEVDVVLPVHYDGSDLELVARDAELSVEAVVELHAGARYTVAFCGFAPGFGYLSGVPEPLRQARLADPRPDVPAGAVGLAGEFTGVYPRRSPGGWRLIGHTEETLFDPTADPPARLTPGARVRFDPLR